MNETSYPKTLNIVHVVEPHWKIWVSIIWGNHAKMKFPRAEQYEVNYYLVELIIALKLVIKVLEIYVMKQ